MKTLKLNWEQYHHDLKKFAHMVDTNLDDSYEYIVSVATGGWIPALVFMRYTRIKKVFSFGTYGYDKLKQLPAQVIYQTPPLDKLRGKKVLIVDNLTDTGRTLHRVTKWFKKNGIEFKTACLYKKCRSSFEPDFYMYDTSSWLVFPYEKITEFLPRKANLYKPRRV